MDPKKIKEKVTRKVARKACKAASKVARKACKVRMAATMSVALMVAACGCQETPSRAQTLTMRDCVVNIYGGGDTNRACSVEVCTQAMSIETGGNESFTPTQTTDTRPDVDVTVGGKASADGLTDAARGLVNGCTGGACRDCAK